MGVQHYSDGVRPESVLLSRRSGCVYVCTPTLLLWTTSTRPCSDARDARFRRGEGGVAEPQSGCPRPRSWANAKADGQRSAAGSARSQCRLRDRGSARVRHTLRLATVPPAPRLQHPDGARGLHCTEVPLYATPERRGARCASRPRRQRRGPRRPLLRHGPPVPRRRAGPARRRPGSC